MPEQIELVFAVRITTEDNFVLDGTHRKGDLPSETYKILAWLIPSYSLKFRFAVQAVAELLFTVGILTDDYSYSGTVQI